MSEMSLHFRHESRTDVIKGCNLSYTRHYISNYNRPEDDELIIDGNTDIVEMIEKAVNEHDSLVAEVDWLRNSLCNSNEFIGKQSESILDLQDMLKETTERAEKAEAELERLKKLTCKLSVCRLRIEEESEGDENV